MLTSSPHYAKSCTLSSLSCRDPSCSGPSLYHPMVRSEYQSNVVASPSRVTGQILPGASGGSRCEASRGVWVSLPPRRAGLLCYRARVVGNCESLCESAITRLPFPPLHPVPQLKSGGGAGLTDLRARLVVRGRRFCPISISFPSPSRVGWGSQFCAFRAAPLTSRASAGQ